MDWEANCDVQQSRLLVDIVLFDERRMISGCDTNGTYFGPASPDGELSWVGI